MTTSKSYIITRLHTQALDEIGEALIRLQDKTLEIGEIPRRFEDWSVDDGDVLWWDVSLTDGEIQHPPKAIGTPQDLDDTSFPEFLVWVPLPKLARSRP